jgi:aryl-alcohol dehydrogenase-like predicted oxidoreductase
MSAMQYTNLGRTALSVSRLCLGTMNLGKEADEATSFAIMDRAHEHGLNFFDTANVYGGRPGGGLTEEIMGRWFAQGAGRRERTVLATKVFGRMGEWPNEGRLSALHIRQACEDSLRRLQTDHIDLYQMHHVWRDAPWEEIWQAMDTLVTHGKVLYVGTSNFAAWNIVQGNEIGRARGALGLVSEQSLYNLTVRTVELEVLPACKASGIGVLPWSPLAGGLLAGVLDRPGDGRRGTTAMADRVAGARDKLKAWEGFCQQRGESPAAVGLAWLLANEAVTAPVIGPRSVEQLDSGLAALDIELSTEALAQLDQIFPGPGNQAPEAYAW